MRKIKLIAFLTSILSALSLLSTGFSSWYYVNYPETKQAFGAMTAYEVEEMEIEITEMSVFTFSATSFKDGTANSAEGKITINYKIPKSVVAAANGKFQVICNLTYSDLSSYAGGENILFKELHAKSNTSENNWVDVTCSNASTKGTPTVTPEKITNTLSFEGVNTNADFAFTVDFTFYISNANGNFRNTFGKYISQKSEGSTTHTKFIATAQVMPY